MKLKKLLIQSYLIFFAILSIISIGVFFYYSLLPMTIPEGVTYKEIVWLFLINGMIYAFFCFSLKKKSPLRALLLLTIHFVIVGSFIRGFDIYNIMLISIELVLYAYLMIQLARVRPVAGIDLSG